MSSPPSLSQKADIIVPAFNEQSAELVSVGINSPAIETSIPETLARKKKEKTPFPAFPTLDEVVYLREYGKRK